MPHRRVIAVDKNWLFKQADNEASEFLPVAQFPTNVHLDLMHNGLIPDPFIGKNESEVQWVGEKAWVYRTSFPTPELLGEGDKAILAFDGLDTYATVVLNNKKILTTENMFVPERVDVTNLLRPSPEENVLELTFDSAFLIGKKIMEEHRHHHWGCWNGDPSRLAVRKAQYHYGWDWGPILMTCGPWRPINLEIYSARISDLYFRTRVDSSLQGAEVTASVEVEGGPEAGSVTVRLSLDGEEKASASATVKQGIATVTFRVTKPQLWYPASYGKQPLYDLTATLTADGVELDSSAKRLGLRHAVLIQRPLKDAPGSTFFFEVNKIPVFCGGSNWIPADNFVPRVSRQRYRDWIKLLRDGNQVMVRVWGGGIYEEAAFYEACDEMGILVWQDFLFGCGNYPAFPEFLKSVEREAIANVKRLRHHPSIVLLAGNNEDYQYMESENLEYDYLDKDPSNWLKTTFPARYIYEKLLADICKSLIPDTYYHFGSPWGGGKNTRDPTVGDIHQWNVWHGDQEKYQNFDKLVGRFVSEFGMEAFPSIKTIDGYLPDGKDDLDRYPQSSTVDFHNKADGHERRIALYLVENMQYKFEPFEQFIHCTQLMQAECLASAYRLWKRQWKGPGREYCAGALVWQINDCWPVTSWAIVDHYLRPKHAYYTVKREMAPVTIGLKRTSEKTFADKYTAVYYQMKHKIEMWASNLTLEDKTVSVQIKAWDVITGRETYSSTLCEGYVLQHNRTTEITVLDVPIENGDLDEESRTVVAAYIFEDGEQVARYVNWPEPLKYTHLQKPTKLSAAVSEDGMKVGLAAEVPVKGVAVYSERDNVVFDDNCVDLVPGETVYIGVRGLRKEEQDQLTLRYLGL